ncbi:hypothetical protein VTJ04DRAFT_3497 [Mycothermus thermophilus]|uniref:uncharacterized protein n=1 Tax=Humicola insolens TaxID=85995 RepID=UPI003743FB7B
MTSTPFRTIALAARYDSGHGRMLGMDALRCARAQHATAFGVLFLVPRMLRQMRFSSSGAARATPGSGAMPPSANPCISSPPPNIPSFRVLRRKATTDAASRPSRTGSLFD